jgi:hypothetical protein
MNLGAVSHRAEIAINALEHAYGDETAHLEPREQLIVAARVIRSLLETIEDISLEFKANRGEKR